MQFGLMSMPGSRREVIDDADLVRDAGFHVIATGDHIRHPRDHKAPVLDGWSVLAAWAVLGGDARLAMLVSNAIYRHPAVLAKQAVTVDHLSGGRLDLGVGAGVYPTDHAMSGVPMWQPRERVERLREFVGALRAALCGESSFDGAYYRFDEATVSPGAVQRPHPPLVVGAAGSRMLSLAAEVADVWSAFGGMSISDEDECLGVLAQQRAVVDRCCDNLGRDPRSLRRSVLAFRPLTPWRSRSHFERLVSQLRRLDFDEMILYKPANADERRVFDVVVTDVLPQLKTG